MNLTGWKSIIVIVIWAVYEIIATVVPDFARMDQATIAGVVEALSALVMPIIMLVLRLRTTGPVAPGVAKVPVLNRMIKS